MVTDVRDPRNPKPVNFVPTHPNSVCMHLQAADDLLLHIQEADQRALLSAQEYYGGSDQGGQQPVRQARRGLCRRHDGLRHLRSRPIRARSAFWRWRAWAAPHLVDVGGRYAYASALLDGFTDHILIVIDMADPTKPREVRALVDPRHERRRRRDADLEGPLRAAPRDRGGRLRLWLLARRRADDPGREGQIGAETDRAPQLVPAVSAAARTTRCRCTTAICWWWRTRRR